MLEAPSTELAISEPLTWTEICERYPDQWVVLVEIDWRDKDHNTGFRTARVAGSGKTYREPLVQSRPLRRGYSSFGHYYTGPIVGPVARVFL